MKIVPNHLNLTGKKFTCTGIPNRTRIFYIVGLGKYLQNNDNWCYKIEIREYGSIRIYYILKSNMEYNFRTKYFVEVKE